MEKTDNAMTNPYIILLSGELRVFDMPDAILCKGYICGCENHCDEYPEAVKRFAIKNAIKLDNPELIESDCSILAISTKGTIGRMVEAGNPKGFVPYNEGDKFPLPKGLKVEIVYQASYHLGRKWADLSKEEYELLISTNPGDIRKVAHLIKEPVKQTASLELDCRVANDRFCRIADGCDCPVKSSNSWTHGSCNLHIIKPSESQQDMLNELLRLHFTTETNPLEKFTITRK